MTRIFLSLALLSFLAGCPAGDAGSDQQTIVIDQDPPPTELTTGGGGQLVLSEDDCTTDADCVPSGCCHAAACGNAASAPDCSDVMCTQDCQYGTLDCGGRCLCHEGKCAARLSEAPNIPGVTDQPAQ